MTSIIIGIFQPIGDIKMTLIDDAYNAITRMLGWNKQPNSPYVQQQPMNQKRGK